MVEVSILKMFRHIKSVARFFLTGECGRHEPCREVGGILPQKILRFGGSEMLFSALSKGSQWGGGFYGYRLKFRLFYGYRLSFFSYG